MAVSRHSQRHGSGPCAGGGADLGLWPAPPELASGGCAVGAARDGAFDLFRGLGLHARGAGCGGPVHRADFRLADRLALAGSTDWPGADCRGGPWLCGGSACAGTRGDARGLACGPSAHSCGLSLRRWQCGHPRMVRRRERGNPCAWLLCGAGCHGLCRSCRSDDLANRGRAGGCGLHPARLGYAFCPVSGGDAFAGGGLFGRGLAFGAGLSDRRGKPGLGV